VAKLKEASVAGSDNRQRDIDEYWWFLGRAAERGETVIQASRIWGADLSLKKSAQWALPADIRNTIMSESFLRVLVEMDESSESRGHTPIQVDSFCEEYPVEAFEIATDVLTRVADAASSMVEESGRALAMMEARSERIDRLQAENRQLLDALVAGRAA
jgi:hypothetical protein